MGRDLTGCWILAGRRVRHRLHAGRRVHAPSPCRWAGRPRPRSCSTPSRRRSSCSRLMFGPELEGRVRPPPLRTRRVLARRRLVRRVRDPPVRHGRAVPGARHRAVHRALLHDPDPGRRDHRWRSPPCPGATSRARSSGSRTSAGWCGASRPRPRPISCSRNEHRSKERGADGGERHHGPRLRPVDRPGLLLEGSPREPGGGDQQRQPGDVGPPARHPEPARHQPGRRRGCPALPSR